MATVVELTDPFVSTYTPVPAASTGVCRVCHGVPFRGDFVCNSCSLTSGQVSHPTRQIVPISLYQVLSQLHHVLRNYKDGPRVIREPFQLQVAALLARFLWRHGDCIRSAYGAWDVITTTPSGSSGRIGPHPLESAIGLIPFLADQHRGLLVPGDVQIGHRNASDRGFHVLDTADIDRLRVLLVDDTFTSGAAAQSAASALSLAGAIVVAMVPIGRVIDPTFTDEAGEFWKNMSARPYDFETCCLE